MADDDHCERTRHVEESTLLVAAGRIVEQRVRAARNDEVIAEYEDLIRTIWDRLVPTLGHATVTAIMQRALATTLEHHPFLADLLEIRRDGVSFDRLRMQAVAQESGTVCNAMKEWIANLIGLLAMLTGDIIVRRLLSEMEQER